MNTISYYEILHNWGVIRATGEDAATFLHGQLTQDVKTLTPNEIRLAGYCTAKGRMLATFTLVRQQNGDILLLTQKALIPSLIKRLSMFVLRSKCKLSDASDHIALVGLSVSDNEAAQLTLPSLSSLAAAPLGPDGCIAAWPKAQEPSHRYLAILQNQESDKAPSAFIEQLRSAGITEHTGAFAADDIRAGIAHITEPTVEAFIPQLLNLDLTHGVNFQKGCYPGQEIVARAHYLGKQKRRMYRGVVENAGALNNVAPGQDIFSSEHQNEPAGRIINCAVSIDSTLELLFELPMDLIDKGQLHLGQIDGPLIKVLPLPYPVVQKAA